MKWTRQLIDAQHSVLVAVIHHLDSTKQSNTEVRSLVDQILNHSDNVNQLSREELDEAENAKA